MTLQQLDRPIGAVSPEYSGDRITNSKLIHKRMLAKFSPKQDRHNPTKAGSIHYTTSARLFEYAQSQKLSSLTSRKIANISTPPFEGSFDPWRRSNRYCYKVKTVSNPLPAPLRRSARIKRYPYPQTGMVTHRVTSALKEKQFRQGCDNEASLGFDCTHSHSKMILSSYFPTVDPHGRPSKKNITKTSIRKIPKRKKWKHTTRFDLSSRNLNCYLLR